MKFVLCDEDALVRSMVETIVERQGHDIVGVADHTATGTELVVHGRPDVVVVDLSLGYNTDFDIVDQAIAVGARVIVFSQNADRRHLEQYTPPPVVVAKPDLVALEEAIVRLGVAEPEAPTADRRRRPARAAAGPPPAGLGDAQAFYEALAQATDGDTLAAVEPAEPSDPLEDRDAARVAALVRDTDRVLAGGSSVRVFLAGGGAAGRDAFLGRLRELAPGLADRAAVRSVVIAAGESSTDAYDRLRTAGQVDRP